MVVPSNKLNKAVVFNGKFKGTGIKKSRRVGKKISYVKLGDNKLFLSASYV